MWATGAAGPAEQKEQHISEPAPVEVEAHTCKVRWSPETEAHAHLMLSFPPDAEAQTIELRYSPPATEGEQPEIELHGRLH